MNNIKTFIASELTYYVRLYGKITANGEEYLQYDNDINKLSGQYEIILAACIVNDPEEDEKIKSIAREYDRMYMILRLNGVYDSNTFQDLSYALNEKIVNQPIEAYRKIFDEIIISAIKEKKGYEVHSLLDESEFKARGYDNMESRSLRYLLARVEKFICEKTNQQMKENVISLTTHTGAKTGYHIEHILSNNPTNVSYFKTEEEFNVQRNILGGLLLLKGIDNISSGNEIYAEKIRTYSSGLVWGHTLCEDFYHNNHAIAALNIELTSSCGETIHPIAVFDKSALEERSHLLYEIVKLIWEIA